MTLDLTRDDSILEFTLGGQRFQFFAVDWDSVAMGKPVFHLAKHWRVGPREPSVASSTDVEEMFKQLTNVMLTARLPAADIDARYCLQRAGMYFVELTLHPRIFLNQSERDYRTHFEMRESDSREFDLLLSDSTSAFSYSRFFRDPLVPKDSAESRFSSWLRSSQDSPDKNLWVFLAGDGEPLGYFLERADGQNKFLELTAMFSHARGRGQASRVWETYLANQQTEGILSVATNISAENSKVVGLYPRLGFEFLESSVALHGHF